MLHLNMRLTKLNLQCLNFKNACRKLLVYYKSVTNKSKPSCFGGYRAGVCECLEFFQTQTRRECLNEQIEFFWDPERRSGRLCSCLNCFSPCHFDSAFNSLSITTTSTCDNNDIGIGSFVTVCRSYLRPLIDRGWGCWCRSSLLCPAPPQPNPHVTNNWTLSVCLSIQWRNHSDVIKVS